MTSSVKITAHCAKEKQVRVSVTGRPDVTLNDGESFDGVFYDDIEVSTKEELKGPE